MNVTLIALFIYMEYFILFLLESWFLLEHLDGMVKILRKHHVTAWIVGP